MKKIILILTSLALIFLCSCEAIFIAPPKTQLSEDDFLFYDLEDDYSYKIDVNQYLYITSEGAYYYDMENGNDMTINAPVSTGRGIAYASAYQTFADEYKLEENYAAWNINAVNNEDSEEHLLAYKGESINQLVEEYGESISSVYMCIGYYKKGKKWLRLDSDSLLTLTQGKEGFGVEDSDEYVVISININQNQQIEELCFYYADTDKIINQFK